MKNPQGNVVPDLKPVEEIRLRNFLELQSRVGGYGAPTATYFASVLSERDAAVTPAQLTNIYQKVKPISSIFASKIERALSLPQGWLSEDHEFLFTLTPADLDAHKLFSSLPPKIKANIFAVIFDLAKVRRSEEM